MNRQHHRQARPLRFLAVPLAAFVALAMSPAYADAGGEPNQNSETAQASTHANSKANESASAKDTQTSAENESKGHVKAEGHAGTSGDADSPQPISTADDNEGGANGQCPEGPYCSTRDGSASMNGNGDGNATGRPCAGCVGKADNKNPAGQMPNGSDHNAGYECDRNAGIGQTNPAHTGCVPQEQPAPETPTVPEQPSQPEQPNQPNQPERPERPEVAGTEDEKPPVAVAFRPPPTQVDVPVALAPAAVAPAAAAAALPQTGAGESLRMLTAMGLGLTALGGVMLLRRRSTDNS